MKFRKELWEYFVMGLSFTQMTVCGTVTASVVHHGEDQKLVFQCEKAQLAAPRALRRITGQTDPGAQNR